MNLNQILLAAAMGEVMPLKFNTLPLTEAEADTSHFVVEMLGALNANETGTGGGITGADQTLTRFGTVSATSSSWRDITAGGGFNVTSAFADAFIRNSSGYAMLWHLKNVGGLGRLFRTAGTSPTAFSLSIYADAPAIVEFYSNGYFGTYTSIGLVSRADLFPSSGEFFVLFSVDYTNNLSFCGISIGSTQPKIITDFDFYSVSASAQNPLASTLTLSYSGIIGAADSPAFSVKSFTAKKGPSVMLV